mgnify:CR=1 FL=1
MSKPPKIFFCPSCGRRVIETPHKLYGKPACKTCYSNFMRYEVPIIKINEKQK